MLPPNGTSTEDSPQSPLRYAGWQAVRQGCREVVACGGPPTHCTATYPSVIPALILGLLIGIVIGAAWRVVYGLDQRNLPSARDVASSLSSPKSPEGPMPPARHDWGRTDKRAAQASATLLMAASVAPIPCFAASLRRPISLAASSPKIFSKKAEPSGGSSQVSVTSVPPSTAMNE